MKPLPRNIYLQMIFANSSYINQHNHLSNNNNNNNNKSRHRIKVHGPIMTETRTLKQETLTKICRH